VPKFEEWAEVEIIFRKFIAEKRHPVSESRHPNSINAMPTGLSYDGERCERDEPKEGSLPQSVPKSPKRLPGQIK